ncbi:ribosome protection translation G-like protein factor that confers tetracycline resistance TetM/TetO-like protein [Psychroflexus torquis ATCC 700755]|uniref:Tetracycline resistance protein TetQ n=1 Tax=Psychroflexus torquis (strain ATCC 700755 / CIP 106069 / ACAM 623) TaxID=313595 RepID=K4ID34_PSYTT|nr:TetM/TetW/TetO/TetS family tetracycline resistance ribosomal protection protein [Psychroflexus torquis]AFU68334.1 ribosome protection translation G-like protein factor that confers tetracycline resistance TetM/TetO-like protein [Psychroflexus torquis ATCC 700755]
MKKPTINIGILAHVDAGKTTLTEQFLYNSGAIKILGSVDKGSTRTDSLDIEKERGISIKAATTSFEWKGVKINLIDTPGHVDFSSEVERVLCIVDTAVLVVSAVEGVQAHTLNIWDSLKELQIPTLIFINKIDRQGADAETTIAQLEHDLKAKPVVLFSSENEGLTNAAITSVFNTSTHTEIKEKTIEHLLECEEHLLERFLNSESITDDDYLQRIRRLTIDNMITPVYTGIAKKNIGVTELMDGIIDYCPTSKTTTTKELSAFVFKLEHHKIYGTMAHVKVFSGELSSKSTIYNHTQQLESKINQTKQLHHTKYTDNVILTAGNIGVITGVLGTKSGDVIGNPEGIPKLPQLHIPVLTVQVIPDNNTDYNALAEALQQLDREDPSLSFKWFKAEKELQLLLMGQMQIEILEYVLNTRFSIKASFTDPEVVYKETISSKAEGYIRYWMPKPCWAIMTFLIEPAPLNSGVRYRSIVSQNDVHIKYQNEIERSIPKALVQGILGWEVTDVKITLIKGEDHNVHSRPGDFNLATPMGIMQGLKIGGTHLLEPILSFEIKANEALLGKIVSELSTRRANFETPQFVDDTFRLRGTIPVATSLDFSIKLNAITSGKLRLKLQFYGYDTCPKGEGAIREYKGVNPLDEAQWILHRRGAYKADERII